MDTTGLGSLHGMRLEAALAYGEGSVVYRAVATDGTPCVLKRIVRRAGDDDRRLQHADREYEIGRRIIHPSLRRSLAIWRTPRLGPTREVTIQLEYLDGPSFAESPPADTEELRQLIVDTTAALGALHAAGLVHGDVKPANLLRHGAGVRLIDYGVAGPTGARPPRIMGSALPPEQLARAPRTPASDVFGLAATLRLLCQSLPLGDRLSAVVDRALAEAPHDRPALSRFVSVLGTSSLSD